MRLGIDGETGFTAEPQRQLRVALIAAVVLSVLFARGEVMAQQPAAVNGERVHAVATAQRVTEPVLVDGRNLEAVWREAPVASEFRQYVPVQGATPSQRTEVQVGYDERNLYVFVRAFDAHPDSIMRALSRRDVRGPSDQIVVLIDSYNDRRTGFEFAVNPDGVKRDYAVYGDEREDESWNAVWDVATAVDSLGWTAEFRIPLSQLRYPDAPAHRFGFAVFRDIERHRERISWPEYDRSKPGMASQAGTLEGLVGLSASRSLELTPYTVAKNETRAAGSRFERAQSFSLGGDIKLRVTPNATLDATVNPDFGQVEADPAVLNLSAFETFLSERRPFFVEGTGLYQFQLNCYIVVDCSTNEGLFYSRRIGRSPVLRDTYGDAATPASTPIVAAAKLTARTRSGLSIGVLDAVTQRVAGSNQRSVEPRSNFAALSAEQDLRGGEAGIRITATAVNRALDEWTLPFLHQSAYAAGVSVRNRMLARNYELNASLAVSRLAGDARAMARTQRNAVHYYQQPADDVVLDTTRTSLAGHAAQLKFGKYGGGRTRFETSLVRQSAGFDVNDLGYLRRADRQDWSTWAALVFNTPRRAYLWLRLNANHWETWNTGGTLLDNAVNVNGHIGLHNNWSLHGGFTAAGITPTYCDRCTRGGPLLRNSRAYNSWFAINGDSRRPTVPSLSGSVSFDHEGRSRTTSLNPSVNMRLSTRFEARLGVNARNHQFDAQWFGNFAAAGVVHHSFARLQQRTLSMSVRANYTAATNLTLQFYGEPFLSNGSYANFRELSPTPGAAAYDARFIPYSPPPAEPTGFTVKQLRTNAVARWEYLPGSTLYLVWSHGRQDYHRFDTNRAWPREYGDLLELHPDNTFLIKLAYWLNR